MNSVESVSASLSQGSSSGIGESLPGAVLDTSAPEREKVFLNNLHVYIYIEQDMVDLYSPTLSEKMYKSCHWGGILSKGTNIEKFYF